MPQSGSLCGALDDARDIGHDEGDPLVHIDHAQIGKEGGKMVVCDLGPGLGHHGKERGFPHIGKPHQTHVG